MKENWSKEKVIFEIQLLVSNNKSIKYTDVRKVRYSLILASYRYFGSWRTAVNAAGYTSINRRWNKDEVIVEILNRKTSGLPLNSLSIRKTDHKLLSAAGRWFGSWENAIKAAGLDYLPLYDEWSDKQVLVDINKRIKDGLSIRGHDVYLDNSKLYAAKSRFKSWREAVSSAGLLDEYISVKWNKLKIKAVIEQRVAEGKKVNSWSVQKDDESLYTGAVRHFGSWDNALTACGLDLSEIKEWGFWTPEVVIKRIKQRVQDGKKLYLTTVSKQNGSLVVMSKRFFGSWAKAVEAAGFQYKRKPCSKFGERILSFILRDFFPRQIIHPNYRRIPWLINKSGNFLELDFYLPDIPLGIEFQGPVHFRQVFKKHDIGSQRERDELKRKLCKQHNLPLIEIPYTKLFPEYVANELVNQNIPFKFSSRTQAICEKYANRLNNTNLKET